MSAALALLPTVEAASGERGQLVLSPRAAFAPLDLGMPRRVRVFFERARAARAEARQRFHPPRGRQLIFRNVILFEPQHQKGRSLSINKLTPMERLRAKRLDDLRASAARLHLPVLQRPRTRQECENSPRPCPWVSCQYHLYLDVARRAAHLNFPDIEPGDLVHSCALDVAEYGGVMLEEVGQLLNVTMERARQIEEDAVGKMKLYAESRPGSVFVRTLEARRVSGPR